MNTNEFENLMRNLEAGNSGYMCFDRKEACCSWKPAPEGNACW